MNTFDYNDGRVAAILGPTNTGKTHYAIERMLAHRTGMIGFPLRLLARENYDRVVKAKGKSQVALVTGEEKIIPPHPRYFICTVEAMPLDRMVEFMAIDEIQMCADPDRGHVFTDRLLYARGIDETLFLGADTVRGLISSLIPGIEIQSRPRMSQLTYAGVKKINRLPRRSAVVAFSAADVYAIADQVRRHRGGAAVVLGALSPRTRNAQVEMYQSGEVDFLVATDAIGMGLNMDIDHVAFAQTVKYDGAGPRRLLPSEVGQIAGRAGRHMNDGTFGLTVDSGGGFTGETVERVENHDFQPVKALYWRNPKLRFNSVDALLKSLLVSPPRAEFLRERRADDVAALESLARIPSLRQRANHPDTVKLLWEICQIPDFQKILPEAHARLLHRLFLYLTADAGVIPDSFLNHHLQRIDRVDGDIAHLSQRIAQIRVWTTVANHAGWVLDKNHWQERTRVIEDRLSDALHDRLTQKFVDRRTAVLLSRLKGQSKLEATVTPNGDVHIEGQRIGRLEGLGFIADTEGASDQAEKVIAAAASQALRGELATRAQALSVAPDETFTINEAGDILWHGAAVAHLVVGAERLKPQVEALANDLLETTSLDLIRTRAQSWIEAHMRSALRPLFALIDADIAGLARGVAFRIVEAGGTMRRASLAQDMTQLSDDDRKGLGKIGVRFGVETVYLPEMLKPAAQKLLLILTAVDRKVDDVAAFVNAHSPLTPGQVSFPLADGVAEEWVELQGYRVFNRRACRVDMLERFSAEVRRFLRDEALTTKVDSAPNKPKDEAEEAKPAEAPAEEAKGEEAVADAPVVEEAPKADAEEAKAAEAPAEPEKPAAPQGAKILPPALMSLLGVGADDTMAILSTLGYRVTDANEGLAVQPKKAQKKRFTKRPPQGDGENAGAPRRGKGGPKGKGGKPQRGKGPKGEGRPAQKRDEKPKEIDPDSPFAVLKNWGKN